MLPHLRHSSGGGLQLVRPRAAVVVRLSAASRAPFSSAPAAAADGLAGRIFNPTALSRLEKDKSDGPVLLVDLVKLRIPQPPKQSDWKKGLKRPASEAWQAHCDKLAEVGAAHGYNHRLTLRPHKTASVLNGNGALHSYDEIRITEYSSAAGAHACLTDPDLAALRDEAVDLPNARGALSTSDGYGHGSGQGGSVVLLARPSAAFATMPSFEEAGGEAAGPVAAGDSPPVEKTPFAHEANANKRNWENLAAMPTDHMYAFNLIRTPNPETYQQYSSHFSELPDKYGMRFVEVAGCSADPDESVLLGTGPGHGGTGFDLLAAVYFPSSSCFAKAWSDEDLVKDAYPIRQEMLESGSKARSGGDRFEHVWLRCGRAD